MSAIIFVHLIMQILRVQGLHLSIAFLLYKETLWIFFKHNYMPSKYFFAFLLPYNFSPRSRDKIVPSAVDEILQVVIH